MARGSLGADVLRAQPKARMCISCGSAKALCDFPFEGAVECRRCDEGRRRALEIDGNPERTFRLPEELRKAGAKGWTVEKAVQEADAATLADRRHRQRPHWSGLQSAWPE